MSLRPLDDHSSGMHITAHLVATDPDDSAETRFSTGPKSLERPSLFGLAPGGVYPAATVTSSAVRSYRTFSPLPVETGGLFSVALSLGLPPPDVIRHLASVEPGLSSLLAKRGHPAIWRGGRIQQLRERGQRQNTPPRRRCGRRFRHPECRPPCFGDSGLGTTPPHPSRRSPD